MKFRRRSEIVQPFELVEPKPEVCSLAVAVLAEQAEFGGEAAAMHAWQLLLRDKHVARRCTNVRPCLIASLILAAMATAPMACTVQRSERERYYAARGHVVEARPGDHAQRLTFWPRTGEQRTTMATAERTTDMP